MLTFDDKVGGWIKKGQNHDDVILEWSLGTLEGANKEFRVFRGTLSVECRPTSKSILPQPTFL